MFEVQFRYLINEFLPICLQSITSPSKFAAGLVDSPHVVVQGDAFHPASESLIHINGEPVLRGKNVLDAPLLLITVYYSLWLEFSKACECTYNFIEVELFGQRKDSKLPAKLLRLLSKVSEPV